MARESPYAADATELALRFLQMARQTLDRCRNGLPADMNADEAAAAINQLEAAIRNAENFLAELGAVDHHTMREVDARLEELRVVFHLFIPHAAPPTIH